MKRETELCDRFADRARESGWTVYPETGGWDLLLVHADSAQVGVQAKLRANVEVIAQAMPSDPLHDLDERPIPSVFSGKGPDFRAVLVPKCTHDFRAVCRALRVHVYTLGTEAWQQRVGAPAEGFRHRLGGRVALPPIVPSWSGGAASPKKLSRWRVGSLRLCALLRAQGFITRADFKAHQIDSSRWVTCGWVTSRGPRGATEYVPGPSPLPDVGYETERDALAALGSEAA